MSESNTKNVSVNFGGLFTVIAFVFLASIGACGESCQSCTQNGLRTTAQAIQGK